GRKAQGSAGVDGQPLLDLLHGPVRDGQHEVVVALPLGVVGQPGEHRLAVAAGLLAGAEQVDLQVGGQGQGAQPRVLVADPAGAVPGLGGRLAVGDGRLDGLVVVEHLDHVDHDTVVGPVDLGDVGGVVAVPQHGGGAVG